MTERIIPPPPPAPEAKPPWKSGRLVLGSFAAAFALAVAALEGIQWVTDWPKWSAVGALAVLCAVAWAAGGVTRSDRWAVVWDCALFAWLSGVLIIGGHLLWPGDGLIEDAVVSWGSIGLIVLWRHWQVRRGVRESMDAPIRHRREETPA